MATITAKFTSVEVVVGGLAARVAAWEAGAISASSVSGTPAGSWPLPGRIDGSTATGSRDVSSWTKTGIQDADSTKTQAQMMRMHALYVHGFHVNNAFPACTHGLKRHSIQPISQKESTAKEEPNQLESCVIQEPKVKILWQDSRMMVSHVWSTVLLVLPRVQFLFVIPDHLNCERSVGVWHRFGNLWKIVATKLQDNFPEHDTEGTHVVPTIEVRAQVLNVFDRRYGIGVPVFKLAPVGHEHLFRIIYLGVSVPGMPDDIL